MKMNRGILYVVSAPSGCGKGTILDAVLRNNSNIYYSVSATTRSPREGEEDGKNYFFYSQDEFNNLIENDGMLEYASFCGNFYGTPRKQVEEKLEQGFDVILEIETNGAMQIKKNSPDAVMIFILPPSIGELRRRLFKRRTENEEVIEKRLAESKREITLASEYDYIMVNAELEKAISDFEAILTASKFSKNKNKNKIDEVLNNA